MTRPDRRQPAAQNHARLLTASGLLAHAVHCGRGDSATARGLARTVDDLVRGILGREDCRSDDLTASTYASPNRPPVDLTLCCHAPPKPTGGPLWYCPACGYVLNADGCGQPA